MALESVSAAETVIQSQDDNDLEDGEIPSDEDDEPMPVAEPVKPAPEPPIPTPVKTESPKHKSFDNKFGKNKKAGSTDKLNRQKGATSDDWAGDVEKAIRAALDEDKSKNHENKSRSRSNKNKNRKRIREEKEDERSRDQKKKKLSDEENANEDDDEMLFIRGASPSRKGSHENSSPRRGDHDNYHSGSDYEDRPVSNRHRDDNKRGGTRWAKQQRELLQRERQQDRNNKVSLGANRRGGAKNERGGKNKNRAQLRNDRNGRRQIMDHNQDPDAICVYYMQGKCHRGDDCPFSHNALPPRKMELCKFYLMDCCAKRDKCLYMHHDFPCKFFHTGLKCQAGENCKFSHQPMSEQVKNILLKHLETAPKEILGNFPRLSREGAMYLISNTEKNLAQGQDSNPKIPSLFELKVQTPNDNAHNDSGKDDDDHSHRDRHGPSQKDRKSTSGKKSRWGPDEDRVPYDMVVQSATQLGLLANNQQQPDKPAANFYTEGESSDAKKDKEKEKEEPNNASETPATNLLNKDVDLRQLIRGAKKPQVVSLADEVASLTKSKLDDESDRDEETDLVIEMPTDDEEKDKHTNKAKVLDTKETVSATVERSKDSPISTSQEIPSNLPKKTQELYMRIQQQQREAQDSFKNLENTEDHEVNQDDWYSDEDNDDDDDDDDDDQLTIVLKDIQKEEEEEDEEKKEPEEEPIPQPSSIPQPAAIVDKLGDLSKIDISMEVSKLLSSIKAQSSSSSKQEKEAAKAKKEASSHPDAVKSNLAEVPSSYTMVDTGSDSPKRSPGPSSVSAVPAQSAPVSRDPRMSRDPRQRRDEQRTSSLGSTGSDGTSTKITDTVKDSRSLRLETSIYSSGIIAQDAVMDTDFRAKLDQDHRRKDMDLRCFPPTGNFGDTDLRMVGGHYSDASKSGDVDLRQMLSLPFKPVPSHVPCTEIDASISSHPSIPYKVYVVDVPRPNYTGLKLTRNDPQVKYDPRLRKIFRLGKDDLADSPMSPPPVKVLDTPKSPPLVRTDPRRKALEAAAQPPKIIPTTMQHPVPEHPNISGMSMGMSTSYMQNVNNMPVDSRGMQGMGPMGPVRGMGASQVMDPTQGMGPPMLMSGSSMMGGMGSMMRDGPVMGVDRGGPMGGDRGGPMGVDRGGPIGVDRSGPMGVDRVGPMGMDRGGPMGIDRGGPMGIDRGVPMDRGGPMSIDRGGPMGADRGGPMGPPGMRMGGMGNMRIDGPPGPNHPNQGQMGSYDPRYNSRGGVGVGLLGAGPQGMGGYNQDVRGAPYDGPPGRGYPGDNYNNYGDGPRGDRRDPRDYNPNGQDFIDEPRTSQGDWNGSQNRMNRKDRRRTTRGKFGSLSRKKDPTS